MIYIDWQIPSTRILGTLWNLFPDWNSIDFFGYFVWKKPNKKPAQTTNPIQTNYYYYYYHSTANNKWIIKLFVFSGSNQFIPQQKRNEYWTEFIAISRIMINSKEKPKIFCLDKNNIVILSKAMTLWLFIECRYFFFCYPYYYYDYQNSFSSNHTHTHTFQ